KHMYSPLQPLTQKNKDKINYDITLLSDMFHEVVTQERNIPLAQRTAWGEGQTFCSPDAKKLGLIDEIGSLSDAKRTLITLIKATQPDTPEKLSFIVPESAPKAA